MGKGKTSTQETAQQIDPMLRNEAIKNMNAIRDLAGMGYNPYTGDDIAGLTSAQTGAMNMSNTFANAFGLDGAAGTSLPQASTDNPYGVPAYSTYDAMGEVSADQQAALDRWYKSASSKSPWQAQPSVDSGKK